MTKPWERQKGETATSYKKFQKYLEVERPVTLKDFCDSQGFTYSSTKRLFYKYNWADRARQYDNELYSAEVEAVKRKRAKEAEDRDSRHIKMALLAQNKGANILAKAEAAITVKDAIRLIETGIKIEREVAGEPSEVHKHEIDVPNEIKIRIVTREDIENERRNATL
jgi:hypothetical protein